MSHTVTEAQFQDLLQTGLGALYPRAVTVFKNFGMFLSFDVANVLLHASNQGEDKVQEVLCLLEEHWQKHLQYQHPKIRGQIAKLGINPTETLFLRICENVLSLKRIPRASGQGNE